MMQSVVHEIRNHLAVAVANVEAFRDGVLEPTPARLRAVLQALAEADVLLGEMPRTALPAALNSSMLSIDVCSVITNEVLALEASARQHGVTFEVHQCTRTGEACQEFLGDAVRIAETVNNVVANAIRYTPPGGHIEVDCRRADGTLMLTVTDSGPGLAPGDEARVFERGFRGSASSGTAGSGLGLSLAKRFAEEHGGSIEALNVTGQGAQFVITLLGTAVTAPPSADADGLISLL